MEFTELIRYRESVRDYDPSKKVPKEIVDRILEAGRIAPSASNLQPWEFLVVSSSEMLKKIHPSYPRSWFINAPLVLIVKGKKDDAWVRRYDGYNSIETDLTIAMDHMILAAANEGLGTCWIAAFNPGILYEALGLKKDEVVFAITPIGYPSDNYQHSGSKSRKRIDEIVRFI